ADAPESKYTIALIFDFDNIDGLNAYQVHPAHVEFAKFIGTIKTERACIDYEF
ncbi:MAG: Dabb family protein, partial [Ruminococcus sp.]|nr:Dabb family protein [Ruminococcus sp.]